MYSAYASRKNFKLTISMSTTSGIIYKHTTKFENELRNHHLVQTILDYNNIPYLSDYVLSQPSMRFGSFSRTSERFGITSGTARLIFNRAVWYERRKLKAFGIDVPEKQNVKWGKK